jgi:hypothetical protein
MIRGSVFYPVTEGASFDHDYYRENHVPLAARTWSPQSVRSTRASTARMWPPCT